MVDAREGTYISSHTNGGIVIVISVDIPSIPSILAVACIGAGASKASGTTMVTKLSSVEIASTVSVAIKLLLSKPAAARLVIAVLPLFLAQIGVVALEPCGGTARRESDPVAVRVRGVVLIDMCVQLGSRSECEKG